MGQLERYGLYVLCVVIVLILGVAIWGGDPASASGGPDRELEQALAAGAEDPVLGDPAARGQGEQGLGFFDQVTPPAQAPSEDLDEDLDDVSFVEGAGGETRIEEPPAAAETAPRTEPAPAATHALRTYRVKKNDTMSGIAKRLLGGERYARRIQDLNPDVNPRAMRPGTELKLPSEAQLEAARATVTQDGWREYKVRKGDSASVISKKMYGTTRYAKRILEENGIDDPTKLQLNTVLRIPPVK